MLRPLLLRTGKRYQIDREEEVIFPELGKQVSLIFGREERGFFFCSRLFLPNNRETINSRQHFQQQPFIKISPQGSELRFDFSPLEAYSEDRIKFMAKIEVDETRCEQQRNEVSIIKQPIHSNEDIITFLLVVKWFPNSMRSFKNLRKASFASDKELPRGKGKRVESAELLMLVFLLAEKVYLPQRFVDEFLQVIGERNEVQPRQANCLTVVLPSPKEQFLSTNYTSAQSQYHEYLCDPLNRSDVYDRSSINSSEHRLALPRRKSGRISDRSPRSLRNSEVGSAEVKRRVVKCNLKKAKKYFCAIEYLMTDSELKPEMIGGHLNEDKNVVNLGLCFQAIKEVIKTWPKCSNFLQLYHLNRDKSLQAEMIHCLQNYKQMVSMQLQEAGAISVEGIYSITRQFHNKATDAFLNSTRHYIHQPNYQECILQVQAELSVCESQLMNSYALTKYQHGQRVIHDLEKRGRRGGNSSIFMQIIGCEEVSQLDIGYKMYKQIIESRLSDGFAELISSKNHLRRAAAFTGNNQEDLLANIETRIEFCQQKRKMLEAAIELSQKQAASLQQYLDNFKVARTEMQSISEPAD